MTTEIEALKHTVEEQRLKDKFKIPLQDRAAPDLERAAKLTLRHYAQSFAFSQNLWLGTQPANIAETQLPTAYDPKTRLSLPDPDSNITVELNELYGLVWELTQNLPSGNRDWVQSEQTMKQASNPGFLLISSNILI